MKQILFAVVAAATFSSAFAADGTFAASSIIGGVREYTFDVDGTTKLAAAKGAVQFVVNGAVVGAGTYNFLQAGTFSSGDISIPGAAGQTVQITIDVWDKTTGATYDIASKSGAYLPSQTVTVTLGGGGNPPATSAALTGFTGGKLILAPEPSTVALAALGLGGLLFISRRK